MTSGSHLKDDLPNSLNSPVNRHHQQNSHGKSKVAPLLSYLFPSSSHRFPMKRTNAEKGYIQVGTADEGNKIRRVTHRQGQHPSQNATMPPMMWNDISNSNSNNSHCNLKTEQQTETKENDKESDTKRAEMGRVQRTISRRIERHHGNDGPRIEDQHIPHVSRPPSPVVLIEKKRTYPRLIASEILLKAMETKDSPSLNPLTIKVWEILSSRSYPTEKIPSIGQTSKYYCKPSRLQKASFGNAVIKAVRLNDATKLESLLSSGLSRNPCNTFGESILDSICKRGNEELFQTLMKCGGSIQTADSFGRTPLHYAFWCPQPCYSIVEYIVKKDFDMIRVVDKLGKTPMEYAPTKKIDEWISFFVNHQDKLWPTTKDTTTIQSNDDLSGSCISSTNDDTLPDPPNSLPEETAQQVSSGSIQPEELSFYSERNIVSEPISPPSSKFRFS